MIEIGFTLSGVLKKSGKTLTNIYSMMELVISGYTENKPHQRRFPEEFTKVCEQLPPIQAVGRRCSVKMVFNFIKKDSGKGAFLQILRNF